MKHWSRRTFLGAGLGGLLASSLRAAERAPGGDGQALIDAFVEASGFQGVILFARRGKPVNARSFGMADIEAHRSATVDTPYALASISKWLTAITVLRLVEQQRLDLDAPITRYLKSYRADTGDKVRLRHLLSNTSGIPNLFAPKIKGDPSLWTRALATDEAITAFCSGDLAFEPGSRFSYDFTNWILVKGIVEAVAGGDFEATVRTLTLAPLGLSHTLPGHSDQALAQTAAAYTSVSPPVRKMNPPLAYTLASGGYVGTAGDLLRAAHGVYDRQFLSPASREALNTVLVREEDYALGGRVKTLSVDGTSHRFAWETGRSDGYRSLLAHRLDGESSLVLLNNTSLSQKTLDEFAYAMFGTSLITAG